MDLLLSLPKEVFLGQLFPFLALKDVRRLDCASTNRAFRDALFGLFRGVTIQNSYQPFNDDFFLPISIGFARWLSKREICAEKINFGCQTLSNNEYLGLLRCVFATTEVGLSGFSKVPHVLAKLLATCSNLKRLNWDCCEMTDEVASELSPCFPLLEKFRCESLPDNQLYTFLANRPSLRELNLQRCYSLTDATLIEICQACPELRSLSLIRCNQVTDAAIQAVANHCRNLQHLNVAHCSLLSDAALIAVAQNCPNLKSLNLYDIARVTDKGICAIAHGCPNLESLVVYGWAPLDAPARISDAAFIAVAEHCRHLRCLNIFWCPHVTDAAVVATTKQCTELKELGISGCPLVSDEMQEFVENTYDISY